MPRSVASLAALLLLLLAVLGPAAAQTRTDINMVVALDRSESISDRDATLQIQGLIYALQHPAFLAAIARGEHRRIGVAVLKWSSFNRYATLMPWQIVGGPEDAARVSALLRRLRYDLARDDGSQTDVALGIERGVALLADAPTRANKEVINVIADGVSNIGHVAVVERDAALARGITINALILARGSAVRVLTAYFRREVIGGPASFVLHTRGLEDFAEAMLRKMLIEVAWLNAESRRQRAGITDELDCAPG